MTSVRLERYTKIVDWDYGYLVVMAKYKGLDEVEEYIDLTESSKSPVSTAESNKQWVGTCLYQKGCKPLLINCEAVIWL